MTYYNAVFDEKQYRSVTDKAANYYLELDKSANIPLIVTDVFDAKQYVHVKFAEATGVTAGLEWTEQGRKMNVRSNYEIFELPRYQGLIQIHNKDISNFGESLISDKHSAEIEELVKEFDDGMFHGPRNDQGLQLQQGLLGQITPLINKTAASGADCSVKGEIWHIIKEFIEDIPFAMRESGPDMLMFIDEKTIATSQGPSRIYKDKVEWNLIYDQFIGEQAVRGRKIGKVIITNKILCDVQDSQSTLHAAADGYQSADTLGTNGRILIMVPDKRWVGRVVSRGFSLIGEEQHMLAIDQLYGARGRVCVFNGDAMNYSEELTF